MPGDGLRLPAFVIVGAMKAATSTLQQQLERQPGVFMSTPKEPNFFSDEERWSRGMEWYASLFEAAGPDELCGEASTHYTKLPTYPQTVERMHQHLGPGVKLIYIMRHPIDRLVSQYIHQWTHRLVDGPIDEALDRNPELIAYSLYSMQLEPYLHTFGREHVLPVFFDRLFASPDAELERVGRFIGSRGELRWDPDLGASNVSSERVRLSPARTAVAGAPIVRTIRRRLMPQSVEERVKDHWRMKERPQLSPESVERLRRTFDEDLARLGTWLGVDLDCDTFRDVTRDLVPGWR